jgi:16S rRNA (adenine1518-N6/adenine1519-N6)-dimethyltransferase
MMRSALSQLFGGKAEEYLNNAGVDPTIRGEALSVEQFLEIGKQLIKHNRTK